MFKHYKSLGFKNPYYIINSNPLVIRSDFNSIINEFKEERTIDVASVVELLNKNYFFADRTILKGINRTPWQSKPNSKFTGWEYNTPPKHGNKKLSERFIAEQLFKKICTEIEEYIGNKKNIGVLLSGGMDSRMVAGALDFLIKNKSLEDINVTALTWGNTDSRDVVYSKEIASRLGWKWKHYIVDSEKLKMNIYETANYGCEYSPIHLHAIPQIRDDNYFDVILAGSYGDSVGRAEYSGKKVTKLSSINHLMWNVSNIVKKDVYKSVLNEIKNDVNSYHKLFPGKVKYMQNEIDYQLHYMRRMLNPCMELLVNRSEFHQVFTKPDVFGFMWSIDPTHRNDLVYKYMMTEFMANLSDIPWSRTGLPFLEKNKTPDVYKKDHHSYVEIINNEILNEVEGMIFSGKLADLNIFNMDNIKQIIKLTSKHPLNNLYYGEKMMWLASLSIFVDKYDVQPHNLLSIRKYKSKSLKSKLRLLSEYYAVKTMSSIK